MSADSKAGRWPLLLVWPVAWRGTDWRGLVAPTPTDPPDESPELSTKERTHFQNHLAGLCNAHDRSSLTCFILHRSAGERINDLHFCNCNSIVHQFALSEQLNDTLRRDFRKFSTLSLWSPRYSRISGDPRTSCPDRGELSTPLEAGWLEPTVYSDGEESTAATHHMIEW